MMTSNKTALITGASRGIGKAIAIKFFQHGYTVFLTCKNNIDLLNNLKDELEKIENHTNKPGCYVYQCDMGNVAEVERLFQSLPTMDVIVNNAGISHVGLLTDMSIREWDNLMATNLNSLFYTSKFGIPKMLANHSGKIINISSVWGTVGASMEVAYSASKGGVNSFTKALAKELAPSNIQVNAIACGLIDTDMNACFSEEDLESVIEEIPADRIGQTEEVARLCLMLSEAPEYLTGQIITLDGGWT